MPNRRDVLAFAAVAGFGASASLSAAQTSQGVSRLQTRLFNFKDDIAPDAAAEAIASLKAAAQAPGIGGFVVGRNFIPDPFPTRFEWIYMVQVDAADDAVADGWDARFQSARDLLESLCRDQVQCDLSCPLPPRYADAAGVGVRHTVMFDFKPDATQAARVRNVEAIRQMGKLPMVRSYLVQPSAGSASDPTQMQWQVVGDFASVADYRAYSAAPVHLAIREDFTANTSRVAFLDVAL
jgi:hypothetical protein